MTTSPRRNCRAFLNVLVSVPFIMSRILAAILNARARRAVAWREEIVNVQRVLDMMQKHRIKPHENELRFVRQLVDRGNFDHSWLPADPNAHVKRVRRREEYRSSPET